MHFTALFLSNEETQRRQKSLDPRGACVRAGVKENIRLRVAGEPLLAK